MLGGQDWGLLYIPSNNYISNKKTYIYDEKTIKGKGNNIFIRKKIDKCCFFYYNDWDGKTNIKNIK